MHLNEYNSYQKSKFIFCTISSYSVFAKLIKCCPEQQPLSLNSLSLKGTVGKWNLGDSAAVGVCGELLSQQSLEITTGDSIHYALSTKRIPSKYEAKGFYLIGVHMFASVYHRNKIKNLQILINMYTHRAFTFEGHLYLEENLPILIPWYKYSTSINKKEHY